MYQSHPLLRRLGVGMLVLVVGLLDLLLPDSLIFPWNYPLGVAVMLGTALICVLLMRRGARGTGLVFAVLGLGALWQLSYHWIDRQIVLSRTDLPTRELERHFVVGYRSASFAREVATRAQVGGLFLTRRNVQGRSVESVATEIADLQALRRTKGLPPLIIMADQEGGAVAHLSPPLAAPPALSTLARLSAAERHARARALGLEVGGELRRLGATMNLAPVCDLMPAQQAALDLHTQLQTRAISADPAITAEIAVAYSGGLLARGITPTAKHFPGLSRVATDTHLFGAVLQTPEAGLEAADWIPFRAMFKLPGTVLMLSHVALQSVDPDVPVSRSRAVVDGLIRGRWHFQGLTITDDLTMGAVEHSGICRAVEGGLDAGVDLLLVSWDIDKLYPALHCAVKALDAGRLDLSMLRQSTARLDALLQQQGLPEIR